tara:strand:+ start:16218 stop:17606 length:1389 start_codon:yes stop_codon:yes gene_type:complete
MHKSQNLAFFNTIKFTDFILVLAVFARISHPITADLSYIALALYSLLGKKQVIQALMLLWFFNLINPTLSSGTNYSNIFQYFIFLCCFLSMLIRFANHKIDRVLLLTIIMSIFFIIHSFFFSQIITISLLKILSWTLVIVTLFMAWLNLSYEEHIQINQWIIKFLLLIALLSLPTLFFNNIGYETTGDGFQGILSHPMVFGPTMSLLGILLIGSQLEQKKISLRNMFYLVLVLSLLFISDSRTAGVALFISLFLVFLYLIFQKRKIVALIAPILSIKFFLILIVLLIFLFLVDYFTFNFIKYFITKSGKVEVDNIFEAYQLSRGPLYEPMFNNIKENIFTGLGFGIASDPQIMRIKYDPIFNLPISAPVEKGLVPLMVFEETGIIGFAIFSYWILTLIIRAKNNGITSMLLVICIILLNMSEGTLFSPGGMGMLNLILITSTAYRIKFKIKDYKFDNLKINA